MCVESKSNEFGMLNPSVIPSVTIDDEDCCKLGSPKLLHIAKGSTVTLPVINTTKIEKDTQKTGIGSLGTRDGMTSHLFIIFIIPLIVIFVIITILNCLY